VLLVTDSTFESHVYSVE